MAQTTEKLTIKSILMMAITLIATALANGFPSDKNGWIVLGIATAGTLLGYIAQSVYLPSTSVLGDLNAKDLLKGVLVALSNFAASLAATAATTEINWLEAGKSAGLVIVMYILKQLASKPTGTPPSK